MVKITVYFPILNATGKIDRNYEDTYQTVYLDLSLFDTEGSIKVRVDNPGYSYTGKWFTYDFYGMRLDEIYNEYLEHIISSLPDQQAMISVWDKISYYWVMDNQFVGFFYEDGKYFIEYGQYETSYWILGTVMDAVALGEKSITATLNVPRAPRTLLEEAREEREETVIIDLSTLLTDGTVGFKTEFLGEGLLYFYKYGGTSLQEAFEGN